MMGVGLIIRNLYEVVAEYSGFGLAACTDTATA
jgi:hypothetical protein